MGSNPIEGASSIEPIFHEKLRVSRRSVEPHKPDLLGSTPRPANTWKLSKSITETFSWERTLALTRTCKCSRGRDCLIFPAIHREACSLSTSRSARSSREQCACPPSCPVNGYTRAYRVRILASLLYVRLWSVWDACDSSKVAGQVRLLAEALLSLGCEGGIRLCEGRGPGSSPGKDIIFRRWSQTARPPVATRFKWVRLPPASFAMILSCNRSRGGDWLIFPAIHREACALSTSRSARSSWEKCACPPSCPVNSYSGHRPNL